MRISVASCMENIWGEKKQTDFAIRWYTIKDWTKTSPRGRWMFNHIQAALEPSGFTFAVSAWPSWPGFFRIACEGLRTAVRSRTALNISYSRQHYTQLHRLSQSDDRKRCAPIGWSTAPKHHRPAAGLLRRFLHIQRWGILLKRQLLKLLWIWKQMLLKLYIYIYICMYVCICMHIQYIWQFNINII